MVHSINRPLVQGSQSEVTPFPQKNRQSQERGTLISSVEIKLQI